MQIKPDFEGRNDEYDDDTIRYFEKLDEDGYFYEVYILADGVKARVIITDHGVSVDYTDGSTVSTNINPIGLFPGAKALTWTMINRILIILEDTGGEGKPYTREEMQAEYQKWIDLGKP